MSDPSNFPDDYLAARLVDRPDLDPDLIPWLDSCLREWGGVSFSEATVADLMRASRAVAAVVVDRSPTAAAVMSGRSNFTAAELLRDMSQADRP